MILYWTTSADAQTNADQIFYNKLLIDSETTNKVSDGTTVKTKADVQAMTVSDAVSTLRSYGCAVSRTLQKVHYEARYAIPVKAVSDDIWWIEKPIESLMTDVTDYTEADSPEESWLPTPPTP